MPNPRPRPPTARTDELGDVLQFMRVLWALVHGLQQASKRMEQQTGVTGPQRLVLRVVGLFPGVSPGDLATLLHVHPSTLTGVLHRLVTRGLLVRATAAGDRRRALLTLTPAGVRLNRLRRGTVEQAVTNGLRRMTPAERERVQRTLTVLAETLASSPRLKPERPASRRRPHQSPRAAPAARPRPRPRGV
ncbi:MAG: MarR family transcriptional regulator [Vicinamibacterales bacterium]